MGHNTEGTEKAALHSSYIVRLRARLLAVQPHWTTIVGFLAAALTTISYFPQVVKTLKTRETKDISLLMYVILSAGLCLWFVYGLLLNELPIIIANGITFALALVILALKIKHG